MKASCLRSAAWVLISAMLVVWRVGNALACAVCGGDPEAPMTAGMNMGILALLVIVGGVLSAFVSFFVFLRRRARVPATATEPDNESTLQP